jgi:cytochrome c-type biogenesis protein CcmF
LSRRDGIVWLIAGAFVLVIIMAMVLGDRQTNIGVVSVIGTGTMWCMVVVVILDVIMLVVRGANSRIITIVNVLLAFSAFIAMELAFLNDYFPIDYVWNYSEANMPLVYKLVAIWAGEAGSIMTWLVLNAVFIFLYRLKNKDKKDRPFLLSVGMAQMISLVLIIVVIALDPFLIKPHPLYGDEGSGLGTLLLTPYMIWHPPFVFLAYAVYLIPFTSVMARSIIKKNVVQGSYEKNFIQFSMRLGWLVLTLGIGIGAYWARTTLGWGGYWAWDPVQTVSLVPWIFSTSYFHTIGFTKEKEKFTRINVAVIFIAIIFATAITRGGSVTSVHAFTGGAELAWLAVLSGAALIALSFYVVFSLIDVIAGESKNRKALFDDLTYFFLLIIAFICTMGLIVSPFSSLLSAYLPINPFDLDPDYYSMTLLIPAAGLSIALVFCSLLKIYPLKKVGLATLVALCAFAGYSAVLLIGSGTFLNPILICYVLAFLSACLALGNSIRAGMDVRQYFRTNARHLVHAGLSLVLIGTITTNVDFQDLVFIPGFFVMIAGIVPSLVVPLMKRAEPREKHQPTAPSPEEIGASRGR